MLDPSKRFHAEAKRLIRMFVSRLRGKTAGGGVERLGRLGRASGCSSHGGYTAVVFIRFMSFVVLPARISRAASVSQ